MPSASAGDARLNRLWAVVCACAGIFLFTWALSWFKASVLNEDLQNRCEVHTASFPFEKSCTHENGTVEGANSLLFDGIFFSSMTAAAVSLTVVLTIEARQRKQSRGARVA
ncbi:hypothetical protein [Actinacidiphila acididurans]|uniref:Vitamin K epoxide reductase family protein n=1 Tax=Actinacidiphila acididurans TaxID=2784346 RepID=A0ABS2TU72_9ACTN|nr:hypothetical protein [Actinacidiphila acididurans]MBM9506882.1 hypothetical protein [Actinacidiphila acididurans]